MTGGAILASAKAVFALSVLVTAKGRSCGDFRMYRPTVVLPNGTPPRLDFEDCKGGSIVVEQDPYYRQYEKGSDPEYPTSPFDLSTLLFVRPFKNTKAASPVLADKCGMYGNDNICMDVYNVTVSVAHFPLLPRSICPQGTAMLLFGEQFPGPTYHVPKGKMTFIRYHNLIDTNDTSHPFRDIEKSWGEKVEKKRHRVKLCAERKERTGSPNEGRGRGIVVHHHGLESLAPFDGWAEDVFCYREFKDYILPGNTASMFWYHDHTLATTSENAYYGLEGVFFNHPCKEPYNMGKVPMHQLHLVDAVVDADCQIVFDRAGAHHNDVWGDINLVNGIPWPVMTLQPRWTRFRILAGSVSRQWFLAFKDGRGRRYNERCRIVGSDGGFVGKDFDGVGGRKYPARGLIVAQAYRWDVICDFRGMQGSLYITNEYNRQFMVPKPPMWCQSHLLVKINFEDDPSKISPPMNVDTDALEDVDTDPNNYNNPENMPDFMGAAPDNSVDEQLVMEELTKLKRRADGSDYDRVTSFSSSGDIWLMSGKGWDTNHASHVKGSFDAKIEKDMYAYVDAKDEKWGSKLSFNNVGQTTVELWKLKAGGSWVHPVHVHLIQFYIIEYAGKPVEESFPELYNMPKDVVHIGGAVGEAVVAARYGPMVGRYMVHEDRDMMMAFAVVDLEYGKIKESGFDPELLQYFLKEGKMYANGTLNARYGYTFYPKLWNDTEFSDMSKAADFWFGLNLYNGFFNTSIPNNPYGVKPCADYVL